MKYKKVTIFVAMEDDEDDVNLSLDLDNMQEGGNSQYSYVYNIDDTDLSGMLLEDEYMAVQLVRRCK